MYSNCIISSDLCHSQQCITNTTHSHRSPLSLHTLSLTWFHSLWGRKSPEVHSGWSDEKWEKSLWPELSGGGVWLYGVTGWEDRKELVAMSAPLLYLQQHNTSQSRQTPAQTADNYNSQYLTSHISLLTNNCNTNQYFSHLRLCFLK